MSRCLALFVAICIAVLSAAGRVSVRAGDVQGHVGAHHVVGIALGDRATSRGNDFRALPSLVTSADGLVPVHQPAVDYPPVATLPPYRGATNLRL
jgi:hypothetical protein